jgi:vacuolar-type H+-ATPase subunit I/STV1
MNYWEFEEYIKLMNERIKEENDKAKKQQEEQEKMHSKYTPNIPNYNSLKPANYTPPKYHR